METRSEQFVTAPQEGRATWIWYPGDFEVWLGNIFNNRRTERGAMFPPFWKQDSHWPTVEFSTQAELEQEETVAVWTEGDFNFMLDGKLLSTASAPEVIWREDGEDNQTYRIRLPKGRHRIHFKVWNQLTPPALFVDGPTVKTSSDWLATYEDKIWIDENGTAHGSGIYVPAASWNFNEPDMPPSTYHLAWREAKPVDSICEGKGRLYDFGRETFGHLVFQSVEGDGVVRIYYGESREEALDKEHCETLDVLTVTNGRTSPTLGSKAFRYVYVETSCALQYELLMREEYAPYDERQSGHFRCSDSQLNQIWEVSARTMDLTTQEFFMDGIKRDRWVWSGDAIQSYLMNYYLRFDSACVKRTIRQLRGKDPVTAHVNTIMDYTFYWFKSVADYYLYTGDIAFLLEIYPRMRTLMDYVGRRLNGDGMAEGKSDDWIFVDWVDFPMHKRGALCFEQILLWEALTAMDRCACALYDHPDANPPQGSLQRNDYLADHTSLAFQAAKLQQTIEKHFWDADQHAFLHALEDGETNRQVTKFPNMFAINDDMVDDERKQDILKHVLSNPDIAPITTPYMRFYELEALCRMGFHATVLQEIKDYWGGMLREGATSFWEKYNPQESGKQHLAMYGRPYGKSLCHAWGASPIYLLGRYFLGVRPLKPGYEEFEVRPSLGGLDWMEGTVPTPAGMIRIYMDRHTLRVSTEAGRGMVVLASDSKPHADNASIEQAGGGMWKVTVDATAEITINY